MVVVQCCRKVTVCQLRIRGKGKHMSVIVYLDRQPVVMVFNIGRHKVGWLVAFSLIASLWLIKWYVMNLVKVVNWEP